PSSQAVVMAFSPSMMKCMCFRESQLPTGAMCPAPSPPKQPVLPCATRATCCPIPTGVTNMSCPVPTKVVCPAPCPPEQRVVPHPHQSDASCCVPTRAMCPAPCHQSNMSCPVPTGARCPAPCPQPAQRATQLASHASLTGATSPQLTQGLSPVYVCTAPSTVMPQPNWHVTTDLWCPFHAFSSLTVFLNSTSPSGRQHSNRDTQINSFFFFFWTTC
uniref:Uncharacterized protein n=1 Tax=Apteryx owenii TaxID=8824 RepID=A0A8B9P4J4_APTOW